MGRAWLSDGWFTLNRIVVDSIDALKNPVDGDEAEIVQLRVARCIAASKKRWGSARAPFFGYLAARSAWGLTSIIQRKPPLIAES